MTFQAYLDTIREKTGKTADDFKALAAAKGFADAGGLTRGTKATQIIDWLAADYGLGRGHAMAIVAVLKGDPRGG